MAPRCTYKRRAQSGVPLSLSFPKHASARQQAHFATIRRASRARLGLDTSRLQTWERLQQQRVGISRIIPPGDRTPATDARVREPAARRQAAVARSIALPTTSTAPGGALPRRRCTRLRLTPSSARPTLTARLPRRAAWERRLRLGDTHGNARRTAGGGARWTVMATDAHGLSCNQSVRQV